jgi:hypothetical protein
MKLKTLLGNLAIVALLSFFVGFSSCSKDDETDTPNETTQTPTLSVTVDSIKSSSAIIKWNEFSADVVAHNVEVYNKETEAVDFTTLLSVDPVTGKLVLQAEATGLSDSTNYEVSVKAMNAAQETVSNVMANFMTLPDTGSASNPADLLAKYETSDFARKWASDDYSIDVYVDLKKNGTGVAVNPNDDKSDITWELKLVEVTEINMETGAILDKEVPGIVITYTDGFYDELVIEENDDEITALYDETNNLRYDRVPCEADEEERIISLPGKLEFEDYAVGGEGITYHDNTVGGGGDYRMGNVDISASGDASNGYALSYVQDGEWLKYAVNVNEAGIYALKLHCAGVWEGSDGLTITVSAGSQSVNMRIPMTGSANAFGEYIFENYFNLEKHIDTIKVSFSGSATIYADYLEFTKEVEVKYDAREFLGMQFLNIDGQYNVEFPEYEHNFGSFYINEEFSDFLMSKVEIKVTYLEFIGQPEEYVNHVGHVMLINQSATGMEKFAGFEIISDTELLYLGTWNECQVNEGSVTIWQESTLIPFKYE